jgi:outer membrane protein assembly factor BamB
MKMLGIAIAIISGFAMTLAQQQGEQEKTQDKNKSSIGSTADKKNTPDKKPVAKDADITKKVRQYNDPKIFASPPTKFRKGHVKPRKLDPKSIVPGKEGFHIDLPSKAPIPTVTFYNGRIYTSGGFRSKEFYCFDANNGRLIWAIDLDDDGPSAAVCDDNICVFNTESCTLFAVDCSTGKQLWSWWLGDPLMSTPTIANGKVFTSYPATGRSSVNEQMGLGGSFNNPQQMQQVGGNPPSINPPANANSKSKQANSNKQDKVSNGGKQPKVKAKQDDNAKPKSSLKAPPQTHVLACFDLKTGKILWQKWIDSDVMSAPIAAGDELFVTSFAGTLYKFKQATGEIVSAKAVRATSAPLIVKGNVLFSKRADTTPAATVNKIGGTAQVMESIASMKSDMKKVDREFGKQKADYLDKNVQSKSKFAQQSAQLDASNGFGGGAPVQANPAASFENVGLNNVSSLQAYQGSRNLWFNGSVINCPGDKIVCNSAAGKQLWSIPLKGDLKKMGGMLAAPPVEAGGQIFVSTLGGEVWQLDPGQGKVVKKYKVGQPLRFPPIVQNGNIYVGTQSGRVVCIKTGDTKLTGWPMWGGNAAHNKTNK